MHDYGAADTSGHYLAVVPLRYLISVYDDRSPMDVVECFYAFGHFACQDVCGGIRHAG